jgi:DNA modification methylase
LEDISFTRKDGQYLRWDYRANKSYGKKDFSKGLIQDFDIAILSKLTEIISDISGENENLFDRIKKVSEGNIRLIEGSCLEQLPILDSNSFHAIITSPPYCNRYDYTRTYALELALLGVNEKGLIDLRQNMLSCTVENREKDLLAYNAKWVTPITICLELKILKIILEHLETLKKENQLNNKGIVRMIKGYFVEMSCVIFELYRTLKKNGFVFMVNDNVRYAGIEIPVDLILSKIAEEIGFKVQNIWILPQKKGNSSQQMGAHGRKELRKCVYIWEKI